MWLQVYGKSTALSLPGAPRSEKSNPDPSHVTLFRGAGGVGGPKSKVAVQRRGGNSSRHEFQPQSPVNIPPSWSSWEISWITSVRWGSAGNKSTGIWLLETELKLLFLLQTIPPPFPVGSGGALAAEPPAIPPPYTPSGALPSAAAAAAAEADRCGGAPLLLIASSSIC